MTDDVLIIGGGAAGLMCALTAGQRGRRVRVIEHANRVGKKILMSGGGRCNFTNLGVTPAQFLSSNPHFCKSALARYTQWDFIAMVERHGIAYHEKELGQLFCNESSKQIVTMLVDECAAADVAIETSCAVLGVEYRQGHYEVATAQGIYRADKLVIASGGLSIPKMGATGFGHGIARQFGLALVPMRAGLVPLTMSGAPLDDYADLAGLAVPLVEACANDIAFRAGMLITHRGLSGPAILQLSSYWQPGDALHVNLLPGIDLHRWLLARQQDRAASELKTVLGELLPKRLAQRLCERWLENRPLRQYRLAELRSIADQLQHWPFTASGTEGYRTAEVTLGGVDTHALSSSTMEARAQPGLYFVGEVVDVTGWLGGYNFQWAWSSGVAAGMAV